MADLGQLERSLGVDVDLVLLNSASSLVAWEALQGEALFIRDQECYLNYLVLLYDRAHEMASIMREMWREGRLACSR